MQQFQVVDYIPWIGSEIVEALVVAIMLKRDLVRRFPVFFASIAYALLRQAVLAAIAAEGTKAYGLAYWTTLPIEYVIAFAVMVEAFRYLLGVGPKIPREMLTIMALAAGFLVAIAILLIRHPDISTSNLRGLILTLDRSIDLLRCGVLILSGLPLGSLAFSGSTMLGELSSAWVSTQPLASSQQPCRQLLETYAATGWPAPSTSAISPPR